MTKKKFLEELEKRLNVLDEAEKQDIINEYKDMIAEKVKHGKTEKEAISDFGSIDELTKEILSAYKINPNYNKKDTTSGEKAKEIVNNGEELIKEGAKKISDFTRSVINDVKSSDSNITFEFIVEIIIKAILMLIAFAILRFPFWIIKELGASILDVAFSPVNHVLIIMWSGLISVLYFITCILIAVVIFKQYFNPSPTSKKVNSNHKKGKANSIKEEVSIKQEKTVDVKSKPTNSASATAVVLILVKIFIVITILIPLFFINIGLVTAFACILFLLLKGLNVLGALILIIGMITIAGYFSSIITGLIFDRTKVYFYPFVIGMILLIFGGIMTIDNVTSIDYYDSLPTNNFKQDTIVYNEQVTKNTYIHSDDDKQDIIIDNNLPDNQIKIEVTYYKDLINLRKNIYSDSDSSSIDIYARYNGSNRRKLFDLVIDELKNEKVYNYSYLFKSEVKIYTNQNTVNLIK